MIDPHTAVEGLHSVYNVAEHFEGMVAVYLTLIHGHHIGMGAYHAVVHVYTKVRIVYTKAAIIIKETRITRISLRPNDKPQLTKANEGDNASAS